MSQREPWKTADDGTGAGREVLSVRLVGDPGRSGRNPLARHLGALVTRGLDYLRRRWALRRGQEAPPPGAAAEMMGSAAETAIGALEGTLKGRGLDGVLKEAQIEFAYAEAREKNAAALKAEAETEKIRQDAALERFERIVELIQKVGGTVNLVTFPDGRIGLVVGDGLVAEIPLEPGELSLPAVPSPALEAQGADDASSATVRDTGR